MKRADFTTPSANLKEAYDNLEIAWAAAKELWSDDVARNFEDNYMDHVRPAVRATLHAVGRLSNSLQIAVGECNDRGQREHL